MAQTPYVTTDDVRAILPFIDDLATGDDFLTQRINARLWMDSAVKAATGLHCFSVRRSAGVTRACAYRAASEILAAQITPNNENAYASMSARFQKMAEGDISTLEVIVNADGFPSGLRVHLGRRERRLHGYTI